jgi:hypothetical protein
MRLLTSASIGVLSLLLGIPAISAQEEKPRQEESKPEATRPHEARPAQQNNEMKPEQNRPQKEEKPSEEKKEQKEESKAAHQDGRSQEHGQPGMEHAKPAGHSPRIPDDKFRQHFGRQHTLVINRPVVVEGQPRFQYAGYWFVIEDPWPADWVYTDDCYIDYVDDEYFLFDLRHPGVRIALFVVM